MLNAKLSGKRISTIFRCTHHPLSTLHPNRPSLPTLEQIGHVARIKVSLIQRSTVRNPAASVCCVLEQHFIRIASVDSAVKRVSGGDNLVKGVQCY